MLENLTAERYYGNAVGAATKPSKMGCRSSSGTVIDVFVKCSWLQCPPGGLVREVVSALLADALQIPSAKPSLVHIEQELLDQIQAISPETCVRMSNSVVPMYGSIALGTGYSLCTPGAPLGPGIIRSAAEIWAFDQLVLNPDRNARKPNCMLKGDGLAIIDHEKALMVEGVGGFLLPAPWDAHWTPDVSHIFNEAVRSGSFDLTRLQNAWREIDGEKTQKILSYVPQSWDIEGVMGSIGNYLADLHANLDSAFKNLMGVTS